MPGSIIGKWPTPTTSWNSSLCKSAACLAPAGHYTEARGSVRVPSEVTWFVIYNLSLETRQLDSSTGYSNHKISLLSFTKTHNQRWPLKKKKIEQGSSLHGHDVPYQVQGVKKK